MLKSIPFLKSLNQEILICVLETIVEPLDMTEANILMPRLFDTGMHRGHPLLVLRNKLENVKFLNSQTQPLDSKSNRNTHISKHRMMNCVSVSSQMYIPLLTGKRMEVTGAGSEAVPSHKESSGEGEEDNLAKSSEQVMIRDELLNRTHKFLGLINTTLQHLQILGLFYLIYPKIVSSKHNKS